MCSTWTHGALGGTVAENALFQVIRDCVMQTLPHVTSEQISPHVNLRDLGADSLDRADIVVAAAQTLRISISSEELADVANLGDLADRMQAKVDSR
jgi:polyketide biosynthesis acyl carrier protein